MNLLHVANEACGTFSGGMKRRLSVAIAMIGNPLVCYLDEPSTGNLASGQPTNLVVVFIPPCFRSGPCIKEDFMDVHQRSKEEQGYFLDHPLHGGSRRLVR